MRMLMLAAAAVTALGAGFVAAPTPAEAQSVSVNVGAPGGRYVMRGGRRVYVTTPAVVCTKTKKIRRNGKVVVIKDC